MKPEVDRIHRRHRLDQVPVVVIPKLPFLRPIAAIASGVLLALCFPSANHGQCVWVWAIPLLFALWSLPERITPVDDETTKKSKRFKRTRRWLGGWSRRSRAWRGGVLGYLAGFVFFAISLRWIFEIRTVVESAFPAAAGWIALSGYLALFPAAWAAFAATIGRPTKGDLCPPAPAPDPNTATSMPGERPKLAEMNAQPSKFGSLFSTSFASLKFALLNAAAWAGLEWIRGWMLTGFGWNGLGVALHQSPTLIQICDIIGVTGLSFVPIFATCILMQTAWRIHLEAGSRRLRPHLDFMVAVTMIILIFFYGVHRASDMPGEDAIAMRTLVIQPNIPQSLKWEEGAATENYRVLNNLSREWLNEDFGVPLFDLVVWPESCLYFYLDHPDHVPYLNSLLKLGNHGLLLGANVYEPRKVHTDPDEIEAVYNSAVLLQEDFSSAQVFHKNHLVPFGEFLPLRNIPGVEAILGGLLPNDFGRGTSTDPLLLDHPSSPDIRIQLSPLICFEDTVPRVARRLVRPGPQVLVNLTNDGWFGQSAQSEQHLVNALFRCVELRRPMIRATNNGTTCIIDSSGSRYDRTEGSRPHPDQENATFLRELPAHVEGSLKGRIKIDPNPPITFFAKFGDVFSIACGLIALVAVAVRLVRSRKLSA